MLGSHQGGNMAKDVHINRGTILLILSMLGSILWFNWDTRERVIAVEANLKNHIEYTIPSTTSSHQFSNLFSSLVNADTVNADTTSSRYSSHSKR
jgi:hypothetical protein